MDAGESEGAGCIDAVAMALTPRRICQPEEMIWHLWAAELAKSLSELPNSESCSMVSTLAIHLMNVVCFMRS